MKLMGNYVFPSMTYGYKSPGHNSAFIEFDGKIYMVYHQRFDIDTELHEPRVHQLFRTKNGWLAVAPFVTEGEMLCAKSYHENEICGVYYLLDHGLDISGQMKKPLKVEFNRNGEIHMFKDQKPESTNTDTKKAVYGTYRLENEIYII